MAKRNRCLLGVLFAVSWLLPLTVWAEDPALDAAPSQESSSTGLANSAPPAALSEEAAPRIPSEPTSGIDSAIRKAQEEVRDPFAITPETEAAVAAAPVAVPAGPVVAVVLEGIGFGSKDAYALIGGDVYYVGDEKNGIKLVEVRRREVDVLVNGGMITVPLFPQEEIQKAKDRAKKKGPKEEASGNQAPETPLPSSEREQPPL